MFKDAVSLTMTIHDVFPLGNVITIAPTPPIQTILKEKKKGGTVPSTPLAPKSTTAVAPFSSALVVLTDLRMCRDPFFLYDPRNM